jgi:hypothetical protein
MGCPRPLELWLAAFYGLERKHYDPEHTRFRFAVQKSIQHRGARTFRILRGCRDLVWSRAGATLGGGLVGWDRASAWPESAVEPRLARGHNCCVFAAGAPTGRCAWEGERCSSQLIQPLSQASSCNRFGTLEAKLSRLGLIKYRLKFRIAGAIAATTLPGFSRQTGNPERPRSASALTL